MRYLQTDDPELAILVIKETDRLENSLNLIAAESHCSSSIREIIGSVFNTKTIEGYPGKRFHAGCIHADAVEKLAIERCKKLFGAEHVNVQPHSGTNANLAVYSALLKEKDKVLSMSLPSGGHLSHGHPASITSRFFDFYHYGVDEKSECIDYDQVELTAHTCRPRMIVAGASSYSRLIDYQRLSDISKKVNAFFVVDMAHLTGLVAAKLIPSPVPYADAVTFTTYKTMMGGRGGVILSRKSLGKKIDSAVFPGCQGTSAVNLIAAKALIFKIAMEEDFCLIQKRTLENAKLFSRLFLNRGYRIVSGGTDNHQVLMDLGPRNLTGRKAQRVLESAGIITNANVLPRDRGHSGRAGGLRIGTSAISARGMGENEVFEIAELIDRLLLNVKDETVLSTVERSVRQLCNAFPTP